MRRLSPLLFALALSCATAPVTKPIALGEEGTPLTRQCELPVLISFSQNLPAALRKEALDGFLYWNDATGEELFALGDELEPDDTPWTRGVVQVGMADPDTLDEYTLAVTYHVPAPDGCMMVTRVEYSPARFAKMDTDYRATVIRHEAGHVLGLGHSPEAGDLMYFQADGLADPKEAGFWEKIQLLARYHLTNVRLFS